jgi:hypothetical protein
MAKEVKSFTVDPDEEEETIEHWQIFGWELKSTQEVRTQDVQKYTGQIESSDGSITNYYETEEGEHYIKLTFERERSMPTYAELCDLEKRYDSIRIPDRPNEPTKPVLEKTGCFVWGISILGAVLGGGLIVKGYVTMGVIFLIVGFMVLVPMMLKESAYSKENAAYLESHAEWANRFDAWEKKCDEVENMKEEIIARAKSLLT